MSTLRKLKFSGQYVRRINHKREIIRPGVHQPGWVKVLRSEPTPRRKVADPGTKRWRALQRGEPRPRAA